MQKIIAGMLLSLAGTVVGAQSLEVGVNGGLTNINGTSVGRLVGDPDQFLSLQNGWRFGVRGTINTRAFIGHEIFYAYNRTTLQYEPSGFEQGMGVHQGGYNFLVYVLPEKFPVRPFVTGGGHFSNFVPPGQSATYGQGSTKFGGNWGGGLKVRVGPFLLFRVDARDYLQPKPFGLSDTSGWMHLVEYSVGVSFTM